MVCECHSRLEDDVGRYDEGRCVGRLVDAQDARLRKVYISADTDIATMS